MPKSSKPPARNRGLLTLPLIVFCSLALLISAAPVHPYTRMETMLAALAVALAGALMSHFWNRRGQPARLDKRAREVLRSEPMQPSSDIRTMSAPQASAPAPAPAPLKPPADRTEVMLISRSNGHIASVTSCLHAWGYSCSVVENSVEAARRLLNRRDKAAPAPGIMIVDALSLEMDPVHLPALLGEGSGLSHTRLLCLCHPASPQTVRSLLAAGYAGLVESPVNKSQLFSLVEGRPVAAFTAENVIDLGRHRQLPKRHGTKKNVLLAEQNRAERSRLERMIRNAGHRVKCVENGEQALDALEQQRFDMAVINLRLPIMNGTQVVKLHRFTTPHQLWVPFIVITDQNNPATLRLCRDLNIQACLFKPAPMAELLHTIAMSPDAVAFPARATHSEPALHAGHETRFLHGELLDRKILQALDQLDNGQDFLPELIEVFERDCGTALRGMREAVNNRERERFLILSGMLLDNAGQLGAFALYEMCLSLGRMGRTEFEQEADRRFLLLSELISRTTQAFRAYLDERKRRLSDSS